MRSSLVVLIAALLVSGPARAWEFAPGDFDEHFMVTGSSIGHLFHIFPQGCEERTDNSRCKFKMAWNGLVAFSEGRKEGPTRSVSIVWYKTPSAEQLFEEALPTLVKMLAPNVPAGDRAEALQSILPDQVTHQQANQSVTIGHTSFTLTNMPDATVWFRADDRAVPIP